MSCIGFILAVTALVPTVSSAPAATPHGELPVGPERAIPSSLAARSYHLIRPVEALDEALDAAWMAPNPRRGMRTLFGPHGITVLPAGETKQEWRFGLSLESYGRAGDPRPVHEAELAVEGNRAEYRRGELVEWYVNDERGLEQGFTLAVPSSSSGAREGDSPLELRLALDTDLSADPSGAGRAIRFRDSDGRVVLHYAGLAAWDATDRMLAASLRLDESELSIQVSDEGAVYPLTVDPLCFVEQAKLVPSDADPGDLFGRVSVSGDTAIVGALGDDDNGSISGSAYVFVRSGTSWSQQQKLLASDGASEDRFGSAVSVSGDTALVGAFGNDDNGASSGSAYVFVRSGTSWTPQAKLLPADGLANDWFGYAVSLSSDTALVGAAKDDDHGNASGSAYVFVRNGTIWIQQAKLLASDGAQANYFGSSVSVIGNAALVGAPNDDDTGFDSGSAYVFALPPQAGTIYCTCLVGPCSNSDTNAGCTNSTSVGAQLTARGTTQPDEVNLLVSGARPLQPAVFFQGDNRVSIPFGDGYLCAGDGNVRVITLLIAFDGTATYGPCFGDPTISSATGVVPGSGVTKRYQFWYRDPGGPCSSNFNLSNGYEITW